MKFCVWHVVFGYGKLNYPTAVFVSWPEVIYYSTQNITHQHMTFLTTRDSAWYIISLVSVPYVPLYVRLQTITFENLDMRSLYLHIRRISTEYGQILIGRSSGQGQGHRTKKVKIHIPVMWKFDRQWLRFYKREESDLHVSWGFLIRRIEWYNSHLWHVTGSDITRN